MPCGVETTRQIVETIRTADKPLTVLEIVRILGRPRSTIRDGILNILETGTPPLAVKHLRVPGRLGRPERAYAIQAEVPSSHSAAVGRFKQHFKPVPLCEAEKLPEPNP